MTGKNIRKLVLAALLAALTAVATMIIRIPTPTQGYIHLGDGMVLICGILLGPGLGALAAGIGSMMADLIGGYMAWVPGTFAIKALTALLGGWLYHRMAGKGMNTITRVVLCGIPAEIIMVLGYFVYEVGMEVVMGSSMGAAAAAPSITEKRRNWRWTPWRKCRSRPLPSAATARSPAVSSSGCCSPAPCAPHKKCCFWMSLFPGLTPR